MERRTIVEKMFGVGSLSTVKERMLEEREELDKRYQRDRVYERCSVSIERFKDASDYRAQNLKKPEK